MALFFPPPLPQPLSTPAGAERGAQQPYLANAFAWLSSKGADNLLSDRGQVGDLPLHRRAIRPQTPRAPPNKSTDKAQRIFQHAAKCGC
jgi:hypothetical protein